MDSELKNKIEKFLKENNELKFFQYIQLTEENIYKIIKVIKNNNFHLFYLNFLYFFLERI